MFNKIPFLLLLLFSCFFTLSTFADETITIDIGSDRTVNYGDTVNINATIGGGCSNFDYSTIYWQEQNDKGDWVSKQSGGTGNLLYSFTATGSKIIRAEIRCPQGTWPLFTNEIISNDEISLTVNSINPIVNAGINNSYRVGSTINLAGSISGTDSSCTTFDYSWEQLSGPIVEINNSGQLLVNSNSYNSASFVFPDTSDSISLRLNITPESCADAGNTFSGTVVYSRKTGGGRSFSAIMLDEVNQLFLDTGSIEKIKIDLNLSKDEYSPFLYFGWNNIGGNSFVNYVLEYSTGSNFDTFSTYETKELFYNLYKNLINDENYIHYFRVKACYNSNCSNYSNVVKYHSEDYLKITCKGGKLASFDDIISSSDLFLDDYYNVKCIKCGINNKDKDDKKFIDLYYKITCEKCKILDFSKSSSSFIDNYYKTSCNKCNKINY